MSQQNVELVRRINEAFNRGDFEPMFALADPAPEFEWAVWVVRDGRVVRWQGFADREAALEAAGLRE